MFEQRRQMVLARCKDLIALANAKFNIQLPNVDIRFDLQGANAGQAGRIRDRYFMRFNTDMMTNEGWNHLYNDTVPHELAHIVCFYRGNDRGHGKWWRYTCRQLGGSGNRCHSEEVTYAKGNTWYYVTKSGMVVALSNTRHRRIQQGGTYTFRNYGAVDRTCWHSLERPEQPTRG